MGTVIQPASVMEGLLSTDQRSNLSVPVPGVAPWLTVLQAGVLAAPDNGGNPVISISQVLRDGTLPMEVAGMGSQLLLRMGYHPGLVVSQPPSLQVFALDRLDNAWLLTNQLGETAASVDATADDAFHNGVRWTGVNPSWIFSLMGAKRVIVAVHLQLEGEGDAASAVLQAKVV